MDQTPLSPGPQPASSRTLRARWVFPVTSPPIRDGVVVISGGRIAAVGPARGEPADDLGHVAVLPGLVNAHTHLDLSGLAAPLGPPGQGLTDWIRRVIDYRRQAGPAIREGFRLGLAESLGLGTTTLADVAQPDWPSEALADSPCDATVFLELIAPRMERVAAAMESARNHLQAGSSAIAKPQAAPTPWRAGLSPHAPYSVHPELLRQAVALSASHHVPLAMHLAESREEIEWLRTGGGPLAALLESLGAWDPTAIQPGRSPLDYLRTLARADRVLVIHGNHLEDAEIGFLAGHRERMAVVYCPRTHAWFGHRPYPLEKLLAAGAAVALGTDSRASAPDLSLLAEIRGVARRHPSVPPQVVIALGTLGGARALGLADAGSLDPGCWANLAVVALPEREAADPHELIVNEDGPVVRTCLRGMWADHCIALHYRNRPI
ncbi:MAG: amidohydrolase family protein [Thermoguttaceae bacterium]|jgi:cytosine/adenosine deaminase-related metal-dependent hydrolase